MQHIAVKINFIDLTFRKWTDIVRTRLISAWISRNSSTCAIFSCSSNSISCLYSSSLFSSLSVLSNSWRSLLRTFSKCNVFDLKWQKPYIIYIYNWLSIGYLMIYFLCLSKAKNKNNWKYETILQLKVQLQCEHVNFDCPLKKILTLASHWASEWWNFTYPAF